MSTDSIAPSAASQMITDTDQRPALSLRQRVYRMLEKPDPSRFSSRLASAFLTTLILVNVAAAVLQSVETLAERYSVQFASLEGLSLVVFSLEYFARLWSAGIDPGYRGLRGLFRFARRPIMMIDAAATFPSILFPALDLRTLRLLRVFRLLRGLKLARHSKGLQIILSVLRSRRDQLMLCVGFTGMLVVFAASVMYYAEHEAQPEAFSSIPAAMWWAVCALTTVGYGDVVPQTEIGRLLASVMSVLGIGLFALPAGILASGFDAELNKARRQSGVCEHCGKVVAPD